MYGYIKEEDLDQLIKKNRKAIVIRGVHTKDIAEYINSCIIILQNQGLNMNIMNKPKIICTRKNEYIILLSFKYNATLSVTDVNILNKFILDMGNACYLSDYCKLLGK